MPDEAAIGDEIVKRLYESPPSKFVAERNRLAKEARADGDRATADAIAALRKPPVSAWAVARLAAEDPDGIDELFAANDKLRGAMSSSGREAGDRFRKASEERQRAVARLAQRAETILERAGASGTRANLDRVSATLLATATDEEGADLVRRGVLDRDLEAGGLGDLFGGVALAPAPQGDAAPSSRVRAAKRPGARAADDAEAKRRRERAEREAEALDAAAKDAEREADRAEKEAREAEREAEAAAKAASARRREADKSRREAVRARERARTAADRLTRG